MVHGALLVDKAEGVSSAKVVATLKRHFSLSKVGHSGTLDPMATGLLVILIGKATRLQSIFLDADKAYEGTILLGQSTDSDDVTGEVIERSEVEPELLNDPQVFARLQNTFSGKILQRPPSVSALKINGQRSYKLARAGKVVEHKHREVSIYESEFFREGDNRIGYRVRCSKGTYVRSIARDIGEQLGVAACLEKIRRTRSHPFELANAKTLEQLQVSSLQEHLISLEQLAADLPQILLESHDCEALRLGNQQPLARATLKSDVGQQLAAIVDMQGSVCGLAERELNSPWKVRFLV